MENKNVTELKEDILAKIEQKNVQPKPKILFLLQHIFMWVLWLVVTLTGAIAIAMTLFVLSYKQYAFYEATHDNFFMFMVEMMPYLWFFVLGLMMVLSVYNLRHIKGGYRYPLWVVLGSSVVFSLVLGICFHMSGWGYGIDKWLGGYSIYNSQEQIEKSLWQRPQAGLLVGTVMKSSREEIPLTIWFRDINGVNWETVIEELSNDDWLMLDSGNTVRMIGQVLSQEPPKFHACGVFLWPYGVIKSGGELQAYRNRMVERLSYHKQISKKDETKTEESFIPSICAKIPPVNRLHLHLTS